jgi:hypothetical protein
MVGTLVVVGIGLIVAGAAHVILPRVLSWTAQTGHAEGALSALVIRLHVGFVGAYLVLTGLVTAASAPDLAAGGRFAAVFSWASAALFLARWVGEVVLVSRALRMEPSLPSWWRWLHLLAMVIIWPGLVVVYAVCGARAGG